MIPKYLSGELCELLGITVPDVLEGDLVTIRCNAEVFKHLFETFAALIKIIPVEKRKQVFHAAWIIDCLKQQLETQIKFSSPSTEHILSILIRLYQDVDEDSPIGLELKALIQELDMDVKDLNRIKNFDE